jgi:hypothetical protein
MAGTRGENGQPPRREDEGAWRSTYRASHGKIKVSNILYERY